MSQANKGPLTGLAGANLGKYLLAKLSAGSAPGAGTPPTFALCGAGERAVGSVCAYAASGNPVTVDLLSSGGTHRLMASGAITALALVYAAASGKISSTPSGPPLGVALHAASADGDIVEVLAFGLEQPGGANSVAAAGSAQGDAAALNLGFNTVSAADGTKGVILPTGVAGDRVEVYNSVATNGLKIYPATSGTINGGSANASITIEGKTLAGFVNVDGTNWAAIFTVNT